MYNFLRCQYCEKIHNDRNRQKSNMTPCKECVPLSHEEVQKRSEAYLPVSKGYISYDDTIPIYWADY